MLAVLFFCLDSLSPAPKETGAQWNIKTADKVILAGSLSRGTATFFFLVGRKSAGVKIYCGEKKKKKGASAAAAAMMIRGTETRIFLFFFLFSSVSFGSLPFFSVSLFGPCPCRPSRSSLPLSQWFGKRSSSSQKRVERPKAKRMVFHAKKHWGSFFYWVEYRGSCSDWPLPCAEG